MRVGQQGAPAETQIDAAGVTSPGTDSSSFLTDGTAPARLDRIAVGPRASARRAAGTDAQPFLLRQPDADALARIAIGGRTLTLCEGLYSLD